MTGFEKLKEQVKDQQDYALQETVRYLLTRKDMEQNYLKEDKSLEGMCRFIKEKGQKHCKNGWNYITNEIVYSWAIMYYSLPNSFLKINDNTKNSSSKKQIKATSNTPIKSNIVSIEKARKQIQEQKANQLSLFGGVS